MLVSIIDFRSYFTVTHTITTCMISLELARLLSLSSEQTKKIYYGAMMHDLGKIGIPIEILEYPGQLTQEQMIIMRSHVLKTRELLEEKIDQEILEIACRHHEKLNGSGYPHSLWENQLTQEQLIVAISDIVIALCGKRSYKTSFSKEKTCEILNQMAQAVEIDSMTVAQVIDNYDLIEGKIWKEAAAVLEKYNTIIVTYSDLLNRKQELIEAKWLYLVFRYSKTGIVNLKID